MSYVYRHIRLDKNEVFYIGIGCDNRNYARSKETINRNNHCKDIANKTGIKKWTVSRITTGVSYKYIQA